MTAILLILALFSIQKQELFPKPSHSFIELEATGVIKIWQIGQYDGKLAEIG